MIEGLGEDDSGESFVTVGEASWLLDEVHSTGHMSFDRIEAVHEACKVGHRLGSNQIISPEDAERAVTVRWTAHDILEIDDDITPQQASYVLYQVQKNADASKGINHEVLESNIDFYKDRTPADWAET